VTASGVLVVITVSVVLIVIPVSALVVGNRVGAPASPGPTSPNSPTGTFSNVTTAEFNAG
jgi:hypothetical protein